MGGQPFLHNWNIHSADRSFIRVLPFPSDALLPAVRHHISPGLLMDTLFLFLIGSFSSQCHPTLILIVTLNFNWMCDRYFLGQQTGLEDEVITHLNISRIRIEDGGTYKCSAENRVGKVDYSATLHVYGMKHINNSKEREREWVSERMRKSEQERGRERKKGRQKEKKKKKVSLSISRGRLHRIADLRAFIFKGRIDFDWLVNSRVKPS